MLLKVGNITFNVTNMLTIAMHDAVSMINHSYQIVNGMNNTLVGGTNPKIRFWSAFRFATKPSVI